MFFCLNWNVFHVIGAYKGTSLNKVDIGEIKFETENLEIRCDGMVIWIIFVYKSTCTDLVI